MIELTLSCLFGLPKAIYICGIKEENAERQALRTKKRIQEFSYGKQSLEVGCFYSGPFFLPKKLKSRRLSRDSVSYM
jgi:hypothetical protein